MFLDILETIHSNQLVIIAKLDHLLTKETMLMAAIDDLNAAVATLSTNFTAADAAIQNEIAALTAALASNNTAGIEAAVTNIGAISANMASDTAALAASLSATATTGAAAAAVKAAAIVPNKTP
jgi:uncharacterized protein YlxW (UPF0749 family)